MAKALAGKAKPTHRNSGLEPTPAGSSVVKNRVSSNIASSVEVLTLSEASQLLKVSTPNLQKEAEAGRIPGRCIQGEWRFSRRAILDWLENRVLPIQPFEEWSPEKEAEIEAEIAAIYEQRRLLGTVGERQKNGAK